MYIAARMKLLLSIIALTSLFFFEEGKLSWTKVAELEVQPTAWSVDPLGNVVYTQGDVIYKLDTSFNVQFQQSTKGLGEITEVDASHAQKTMVFSEDQQQIFFLDNTLTLADASIDLNQENIAYATHVSYSNQPTRYWVYDLDNFKLWLFDDLMPKPTVIENLSGVLNGLTVDALFESENKLFIWDKAKGVYQFDVYGSLIKTYKIENADALTYWNGSIFYFKEEKLMEWTKLGEQKQLEFPLKKVKQFTIEEQDFYVQTDTKIIKYSLNK